MLIRLGYDIQFSLPAPVSIVAMLHVHPSRRADLRQPDEMRTEPFLPVSRYQDSFGNLCSRIAAPAGSLSLSAEGLIEDSGAPDPINTAARELPVDALPNEVLQYLLSSRYCEVDSLSAIATDLFGGTPPGWGRVYAICTWVNTHVRFGYPFARPTRTALETFIERVGVCRDFQHLAVTFCRALNIPARYVTGYLGDFGFPASGPMDFSAWFEVYLDGRWWTFDARHNIPRIGRVLIAVGRDAADVAITTSFGTADLTHFTVITEEAAADVL
ncbi:MAG TPA: transglutaminase family protein [Granulicella sp.]